MASDRSVDVQAFLNENPFSAGKSGIGVVLSSSYAVGSVMLWITYFMGLVIFYALINWMPILFRDAGLEQHKRGAYLGLVPAGRRRGDPVRLADGPLQRQREAHTPLNGVCFLECGARRSGKCRAWVATGPGRRISHKCCKGLSSHADPGQDDTVERDGAEVEQFADVRQTLPGRVRMSRLTPHPMVQTNQVTSWFFMIYGSVLYKLPKLIQSATQTASPYID